MTEFFSTIISFALHIDVHLFELVELYGPAIYVILFLIIFCETGLVVTPFLPGDSLLFAIGTLAGAGKLNIVLAMLCLLSAAVLGDAVNYHIGRFLGPPVFERNYRLLNKKHLRQAHDCYERHGGQAIILARFVHIVRTFAPFVAGVALMNRSRFFSFNVIGALLWVCLLTPLGFFFGNLEIVQKNFTLVIYLIIAISIMPMVVEVLRAKLRARKEQR